MRSVIIAALVAVLASTPACAVFDTATEIETGREAKALKTLYDDITGVTVKVLVMCEVEGSIVSGHGTGVIIGRSGNTYAVITNKHVVDAAYKMATSHNPRFNIEHPGVGNIRAVVAATDDERDLACLTFETSANLPLAKLAATQPPLLTDVYHYGYGGLWYKGAFATKGVFSSKSRFWQSLPCAWTVTCNVWYGSSGGGVFTANGELMGITSLMDIDRQEYLPWLVGVVPYLELEKFLDKTGFKD